MNSNFNCNYMTMSSLAYILGFSVRFFQPVYSVWEYYEIKITSKSFAQKFELKWSLGGPLSKLCVTPPFSINFRCQIENKVSDYRLLGASSFLNSQDTTSSNLFVIINHLKKKFLTCNKICALLQKIGSTKHK
jgi:hypothetical protein